MVNDSKNIYRLNNFGFAYPFSGQHINICGQLEIKAGDCILLQGASGCGKSTLLLALKGLIPHLIQGNLSGEIYFDGQDIKTLGETDLLKIGYLAQNPESQLLCRNVFNELAFGLENQGKSSIYIQEQIYHYAAQFGIINLLQRDVSSLSGGEKQKINLIAILLLEPAVLLLDEPTAFLDPHSAQEVMAIVKLCTGQKTIIIIEHNLHYLEDIVNRSILIDANGLIHEENLQTIQWQQSMHDLPCKYTNSQQEILTVKNLTFDYNGVTLLNKLNLCLHSGEIIAITGRNGSGKSSLLKLLSGVIASQGSIFYNKQDINLIPRKILWATLSLLWQNPENHFLHTSVNAELDNKTNLVQQFNLTRVCTNNPFSLSEGQKRRLSLAITLKNNSKVILLDEPTFGQDFKNKSKLAELINDLAMQGRSFILVSHDLSFINAITSNIYNLEQGSLNKC